MVFVKRRNGVSVYERIVVGFTKSETAREATRHAVALADLLGAELHLVSAFSGGESARADAESALESYALGMARPPATHALPGDAAEAILCVAGEVDADLVVVGNKGMRGAKRVLGSVPNTISHGAHCAVLIVHTT